MSLESKGEIRMLKVPTFDGKEENYQWWWLLFKAYLKLARFKKDIATVPETDLLAN